jgi:hypothetical protein
MHLNTGNERQSMTGQALLYRSRAALLATLALILLLAAALPGHAQDDGIVTSVNGETITREAFHARLRFVRWQYLKEIEKFYELTAGNLGLTKDYILKLVYNLNNPAVLGDAVLTEMEQERLLWQKGEQIGVTPTAEDAEQREASFFSLWTDVPVDELAYSMAAQAFIARWYEDAMAISGQSEADIREVFATEALRRKLFEHLAANMPTEELAIHSRHILCSFHPDDLSDLTPPTPEQRAAAEECIATAQARLGEESFEVVAQDLSDDRTSAQDGGDLGWILISYLTPAYADAVREAELNTLFGPVETEFGLHLVEVLDRRSQVLSEAEFEDSKYGYFELWTGAVWAEANIQRRDDWMADLPADPGLESLDPDVLYAVQQLVG